MNKFHIWSDFPNSFCKICGMPNLIEIAIRILDYDLYSKQWASDNKRKLYEELVISCPIGSDELRLLLEFAYGSKDDSEIEIM